MDVTSVSDATDFARMVLRGVSVIEPPRPGETDLYLELGLSRWMRQTGTRMDDAGPAMLSMRTAVLRASDMDQEMEPIPLYGVDPRVDLINLGSYLRRLMARATARAQCDVAVMVGRALENLRSGPFRSPRGATALA
jgi:hypothetical protein